MFGINKTMSAKTIQCEEMTNIGYIYFGKQKTCRMMNSTSIDQTGVTISNAKDDTVAVIRFKRNKKILYLPQNISEVFPNLIGYDAYHSSLITISRENFHGLTKLKAIWLAENKIEKVSSDTFADLSALEWIWLGNTIFFFLNNSL
jgi:Leucine rich repeat